MKKTNTIMLLLAVFTLVLGSSTMAWASTFQASEANSTATGEPTKGGGTLTRHEDSVRLNVSLSGLDKKSTYSAWYIIFNNPEHCGGLNVGAPCNEPDLSNPDVNAAVLNAGGFVTGTDGTGYFSGELRVNDMPLGMAIFGALNDGMAAEIHVLMQSHSKSKPGAVSSQMSVPGAACNPDCEDQLFLVFLAVE